MTDSKKKHHPSGSLSRRILLVCVVLLVIPLFLQTLFLYTQEYKQKLAEVKENLTLLAKERADSIQETIELEWTLVAAVPPSQLKRIPLQQGLPDRFVFASKRRDALVVGIKESDLSGLVVMVPFSQLTKDLAVSGTLPVRFALIDETGRMLAENKQADESKDLLQVTEPIAKTDLSILVSVPQSAIHDLHLRNYYYRFATLLIFVGVIGGGAVYLLTRRIVRPLRVLCKTMDRVSEGAIHVRYPSDRMGFEINELGLQFNETLDAMIKAMEATEKEKIARGKLVEEFRIGHEIAANLLPTHLPGYPGLDIAPGYFPAKEVNGDFYDLFRLEDGTLLIAIADVAGKGISACLYALGLRSMIRSLATATNDLAEIVRRVNDLYWLDAQASSIFATLWIGIYNPEQHRLTYCSQGHPPAILRRDSQIEELWTGGIALGAQQIDTIATKTIQLQPGDLLFLYTDGIIEAHDPKNKLFGKERLHQFLLRKEESSEHLVRDLVREVEHFSQGAPQHDDMTFLFLHISR